MITIGPYLLLALLAVSVDCLSADVPQDPSAACIKSLQGKPELQMLKGKVDLRATRSPTPEMLANTSRPDEVETVAIATLAGEFENCLRQGEEWRSKNWPPAAIALFEQYVVLARSLIADLKEGKITYSDFAKNKASALVKFKADLIGVAQLIAEEKAQEAKQASKGSAAKARSLAPENGKEDE